MPARFMDFHNFHFTPNAMPSDMLLTELEKSFVQGITFSIPIELRIRGEHFKNIYLQRRNAQRKYIFHRFYGFEIRPHSKKKI